MKIKQFKYYACDFETTVYKGQTNTEVWSSACVELFTENPIVFNSIGQQFDYFLEQKTNICAYYHNLKFDGSFWLYYLMFVKNFEQASIKTNEEGTEIEWLSEKEMKNNTFKYSISDRGQWYSIIIKVKGKFIEIRDSLKLLPFSLKKIGKSFKTKHKKLEMEYEGFRYSGCEISETEMEYIVNDVLVLKEALEIMFEEGHTKLTIGACCLEEFKKSLLTYEYKELFPSLKENTLIAKNEIHTYQDVDSWIRKSYKGGWCYLSKGKENKVFLTGCTADVNSLYPSSMHSCSGNKYPIGSPIFWEGNEIPEKAKEQNKYFFVRIKTRFYLKDRHLPFIQIKNSLLYKSTEYLETSDYYDKKTNKYYQTYYDYEKKLKDTRVELTLTCTDYELLKEHYNLVDFEIIDGCYFYAMVGIFDEYINKYKKIKAESEGAVRELAKLFLNNLYGKMASSDDSSFKVAYKKEDKTVGFLSCEEHGKQPGYIACGSAITSYSRNFTIRIAQKNYDTFIYADTDSVHCSTTPEKLIGVEVHDTDFCKWKIECEWDEAIFVRQKTYIEHITTDSEPHYKVTCAGMPEKSKQLFIKSITDKEINEELTEEQEKFLFDKNGEKIKRDIRDFKLGLCLPDKLMPKRIIGGTLLVNTTYQMR